MTGSPPRLDAWLVERAQALHGTPLDATFTTVSRLALLLPLWLGIAALVALRRRAPVAGVVAAATIGIADLVSAIAKDVLDRPRPIDGVDRLVPLIATPGSAAMPSGHATIAFAAALALGALAPRLRAPLLVLAAAVAVSRVWLGVHYPSDALAGALLGSLVGLAGAALVRRAADAPTSGASPR